MNTGITAARSTSRPAACTACSTRRRTPSPIQPSTVVSGTRATPMSSSVRFSAAAISAALSTSVPSRSNTTSG
ncbi:hypothetical protein G6F21_014072 [Rhizopus arrhizus]|nr:hypothetical protein G6F21_014072 [Rhizopus arrhizus]